MLRMSKGFYTGNILGPLLKSNKFGFTRSVDSSSCAYTWRLLYSSFLGSIV